MTVRQFYSEYWKPLLMTIIPTIVIMGFTTFMTVKIAIEVLNVKTENNKESINRLDKHNEIYDRYVLELQQDCQYIKGQLEIVTTRGGRK